MKKNKKDDFRYGSPNRAILTPREPFLSPAQSLEELTIKKEIVRERCAKPFQRTNKLSIRERQKTLNNEENKYIDNGEAEESQSFKETGSIKKQLSKLALN